MEKAIEVLERFYDLMHKPQTGTNFTDELQKLAGMTQSGLDELYQAAIDQERQNELLAYYERGVSA